MKKKIVASVALLLALLFLSGCSLNTTFLGFDINIEEIDDSIFKNLRNRWLEYDDDSKEYSSIDYSDDDLLELTEDQTVGMTFSNDDKVTKESLLAFAEKYDKDAYAILSTVQKKHKFYNIMDYYEKDDSYTTEFETTVHEMCHVTQDRSSYDYMIYTGDGKWVKMKTHNSTYFPSGEMADSIPEKYRTFRFDTYITPDKGENMSSDIEGCFGLLNEFSAYCWGLKASLCMYNYIKTLEPTYENANPFITAYYNRSCYAEFRFYILSYLLYAKENYPDFYNKIMNNSDFLYAFNKIDAEFRMVINTFACKINEYAEANDNVSISDGEVCFGKGLGQVRIPVDSEDYDLLMKKMEEPEYVEMFEATKNY